LQSRLTALVEASARALIVSSVRDYATVSLPSTASAGGGSSKAVGASGGGAATLAASSAFAGVPSRIAGGTTAELLGTVARPPGINRGAARAIVPGRPTPSDAAYATASFSVSGAAVGGGGGGGGGGSSSRLGGR